MFASVVGPEFLAGREIQCAQLSLSAERIDDAVNDNGNRPGALIESEVVAIGRGILVLPLSRPFQGIECFHDLPVYDSMKEDDVTLSDNRATETCSHIFPPENLWAGCGPRFENGRSFVDPVACRTEKLRPVAGGGLGQKSECENDQ